MLLSPKHSFQATPLNPETETSFGEFSLVLQLLLNCNRTFDGQAVRLTSSLPDRRLKVQQQLQRGLYLEATRAKGNPEFHDYDHAYIVYRDGKGGEWVVRGGPEGDGGVLGGDIVTESGIPLSESKDTYGPGDTPKSRKSIKLDIGDRDPADVFEQMKQKAGEIADSEIDYNLNLLTHAPMQNSNSVVRAVMEEAGVAIPDGITKDKMPGIENDLSDPQDSFKVDPRYWKNPRAKRADNLREHGHPQSRTAKSPPLNPRGKRSEDLRNEGHSSEQNRPQSGDTDPTSRNQGKSLVDDVIEGGDGNDDLQGGAASDTLSPQKQLIDAFTADDGQSDVLYKRTEDITEQEIEGVMKSDTYWESNNPDYLASKEKVNAFYEPNYGTDPVERDATGRMIDSGPKRKIPTEASPAKAADGKPLSQALGEFAKGLSDASAKANQTDQVKTAQEAVNILNNRSKSPQPMLAVDGQAGPKTRAGLRNSLVQNKASHVQDSVALASFKPTVMKAAQSGTTQGLNQATGKSFGGLFAMPQAAGKPTKPTLGSGPTSLGRRAEQSSPQGYGLQIAVNDAAEDHGLFASKTVEPLKEDGIVGPKTEAAFGKVAKEIGSDDVLDRIGQGMGLFG
ncbi:MAG: hypothetical protein ACPGOV_17250 [Magnetovibrionaceae bacterium]